MLALRTLFLVCMKRSFWHALATLLFARTYHPVPRLGVMGALMASVAIVIIGRLMYVCLQPLPYVLPQIRHPRASLVDRHGRELATSLLTYSVYAHPDKIMDVGQTVKALQTVFPNLDAIKTIQLFRARKSFVWVVRHISPDESQAVDALGLEGIDVHKDYKRLYIHDRLFSHVVGTTDVDMRGTSGLEKTLDQRLQNSHQPVRLSMDLALQYIVYNALQQQQEKIQATAANGILADVTTGEILAMVSLPDFSPRTSVDPRDISFFNRNTSGVYEFGSIFKIYNCALFLHHAKGTLASRFAGTPFFIGRKRITDYQGKNRPMSVLEGFIFSSNIVNAHMAEQVGRLHQQAFFDRLGFLKPLRTELAEFARPLVPKDQSRITLATLSFGYGLAITPLHMVAGLGGVVTGSRLPLTFLARQKAPASWKIPVVAPPVVRDVCFLMEQAVLNGQAKKAASLACRVGAKTGTANLLDPRTGRRREKENLTTCVAVFPIDKPRYVLFVSFERGKASKETYGHATAGWFAAPVVNHIIEQAAPLLDVLTYPMTPLSGSTHQAP